MTAGQDNNRGGFYRHLIEAIELNRVRREHYADVTGGRSRSLSNRLILSERLCLPVARYFDAKARHFNEEGIGVVREDFVSMEDVEAPPSPPRYTGQATSTDIAEVTDFLGAYRQAALAANKEADFQEVCRASRDALHELEGREVELGAHFVMSKHVIESAGFAALNALQWARQSDGETVSLSRKLIYCQLRPLTFFVSFDKWAQPLHAEGCGILVNDIPPIPFLERLAFADHAKRNGFE